MKKITYFAALVCFTIGSLASCSSDDSRVNGPSTASGTAAPSANGTGGGNNAPDQGKAGSMARFAISGNHLYTVDNANLNVYDIANPGQPQKRGEVQLGFGVETIFPYNDNLFIGTQAGMFIMGLQNPASPTHVAYYQHVTSCDPVVADGRYAYVTLSSGTTCMRAVNRLEVVDLQTLSNPTMIAEYPMTNPKGLGIDGTNLFVCDDGLKLFDATNVRALQPKQHFKINAYDVIPDNGNLLVIGSDGFYQYQYKDNNLSLLSKINVAPPM